jgi:hypothetical protein
MSQGNLNAATLNGLLNNGFLGGGQNNLLQQQLNLAFLQNNSKFNGLVDNGSVLSSLDYNLLSGLQANNLNDQKKLANSELLMDNANQMNKKPSENRNNNNQSKNNNSFNIDNFSPNGMFKGEDNKNLNMKIHQQNQ